MEINEVVVMYLDASEIHRPQVPDDISPVKGILSHYSLFMLLSRCVYAMREWSCWCVACSRVCGRGDACGTTIDGALLRVQGCKRSALTVWRQGEMTVMRGSGIANRRKRLAELWKQLEAKIGPGKFGCIQVRELWSTSEQLHYRPGHHWVFEFGDVGDGSCVEKNFSDLAHRSWEVYKGVRFNCGDKALRVKRWLHRLESDTSGLTFEPWNPQPHELDPNAQPAHMIVNSSELRGVATRGHTASAEIQEIVPPALRAVMRRASGNTRGARARDMSQFECYQSKFALRPDVDNAWRERCE